MRKEQENKKNREEVVRYLQLNNQIHYVSVAVKGHKICKYP